MKAVTSRKIQGEGRARGQAFVTATLALLVGWSAHSGELVQDTNFLAAIYDYIAKSEYDIRWIEDESVYKSANRAQNLRFTYFNDGFAVEPRDYGEGNPKPWEIVIRLQTFAKAAPAGRTVSNPRWSALRNEASVEADGITIEYINDKEGMRQNFQVASPPEGDEPLQLRFVVQSAGLEAKVNEAENGFSYFDNDGNEIVRYWDLNVWDATERKLEARMVELGPDYFAIVVDDANAAYPILVDPLTDAGYWTESQSGAKFGYSVSYSGYIQSGSDPGGIIVGAPSFDTASYTDAGKVFVYFGVTLPDDPTWTKEGDQAYGKFGWSVATAGDVDNNTYDDIIIGAPYYDSSGYTDNGKAWIYAGASGGLGSTALWSDDGLNSYAHFGYSVAGVGNVSNDSTDYDDVIIGAPDYDYSLTDNGGAFVYHGGSSGPGSSYNWSYFGGQNYAQLGYSVSAAGNVNGDSYVDVIIGAPSASTGGVTKGAAYVFHGASSGLSGTPATTLWGAASGDKFSFSVAGGFDQNDDGYSDMLVGAPYHDNGNTDEGKAYLFRGSSSGISTSAAWTAESNQSNALLGYSVAAGVVTGAGADIQADLLIGVPYYDTTSLSKTDNGEAWFYITDGSGNPPSTYSERAIGGHSYDHNGWSVAIAQILYRTWGLVVGAPDAHDGSGNLTGGTVTTWSYSE